MDEKKKIAVLMFSALEQSVFCAFDKTIIYPVPGGWGLQGSTIFSSCLFCSVSHCKQPSVHLSALLFLLYSVQI